MVPLTASPGETSTAVVLIFTGPKKHQGCVIWLQMLRRKKRTLIVTIELSIF